MTDPTRLPKIKAWHLSRSAIAYVRQSTPQQVAEHQEPTARQYALVRRALDLGWPRDRVQVIDDDLGRSGQTVEGRPGFQRLRAEVALDHVGLVLGLEVSRLARSCKDWHQLLEVCGRFRVLLADTDGLYDPSDYNDRLLLGLKGTMSEAELRIPQERMYQGPLNKARRGELFLRPPIGYARLPSGEWAIDPDEEVQAAVRLILDQFDREPAVDAVLRYLVRNGLRIPARPQCGPNKGPLEWRRPNRTTLRHLLRQPVHAGAYRYGYRQTDSRRKQPGRPGSGRLLRRPEECLALLRDRVPAYLPWDRFQAKQQRLAANRDGPTSPGAPRNGVALLGGLLWCGRCGRRLRGYYPGSRGQPCWYACTLGAATYGAPACQSAPGSVLGQLGAGEIRSAVAPAALAARLAAVAEVERARAALARQWQLRRERARYEADRAARQYQACEPGNRLVARELERRGEEALRQQRQLEDEYQRRQRSAPARLTAEGARALRALAADPPAVRQAGTAAPADRQRIARLLLGRVAVTVDKTSERVDVQLQRAGGLIRSHVVSRPVTRHDRQSDYPRLVERMRAPADQRLHSAEIAARRNDEGFRPPRRAKRFTAGSVQRLAARLGLPRRNYYGSQAGLGRDEFRPRGLARRPGVSREVVRRWLRTGCVTARPDEDRHPIIWAGASELRRPRELQRLQRAGVTGARLEKLKRPKPRPRRQSACSPREEQAPGLVAPRRAPASRGWLCEEPRPSEAAHHVPPPSDRGREAAAASGASLPRSFAPRRRPILLASATGQGPSVIATSLGCSAATVRNASHAFAVEGLSSLMAESSAPKQPSSIWQRQRADELRALLHQSPRPFGKARSTWALELLAEVCHERGLTARQLSAEATRGILVRLGIHLKRAKLWVTSPDPNRAAKKARRDRLIRLAAQHPDGVLGFEDEVWWSRVARPSLGTRTDGEPLKVELLQAEDRDPDPEAIACYGSLRLDLRKVMLRFVEDRPRADVTIPFLDWLCGSVATAGKRVLLVTWDDASWHTADAVSLWVRAHNEHARQSGGVKMVTCEPPVASPRLNNLEPCWKHAKKAIYGARPQTDGGGDGKACLPALRR